MRSLQVEPNVATLFSLPCFGPQNLHSHNFEEEIHFFSTSAHNFEPTFLQQLSILNHKSVLRFSERESEEHDLPSNPFQKEKISFADQRASEGGRVDFSPPGNAGAT